MLAENPANITNAALVGNKTLILTVTVDCRKLLIIQSLQCVNLNDDLSEHVKPIPSIGY